MLLVKVHTGQEGSAKINKATSDLSKPSLSSLRDAYSGRTQTQKCVRCGASGGGQAVRAGAARRCVSCQRPSEAEFIKNKKSGQAERLGWTLLSDALDRTSDLQDASQVSTPRNSVDNFLLTCTGNIWIYGNN